MKTYSRRFGNSMRIKAFNTLCNTCEDLQWFSEYNGERWDSSIVAQKTWSYKCIKGMAKLIKEKVVCELEHMHLKRCVDYLVGKQNWVAFKNSHPFRKESVLDPIHSNSCGPLKRLLGEGYYFVTFIDDHSRKTWVYFFFFLKKGQVFDMF